MALPTMTLKTAPLQFAEFKPLVYQQQVADKNILRDSLNKIEARRREANANKDAYIQSVSEIRDFLDPTEYANFDKEFNNIYNRIGELIELGDSGEAIRVATTAGKDMANDPKWKNKIQVKKQRDKWLADAKASGYDDLTLRRMDKENPYQDNGDGVFKHLEYHKVYPLTDIGQVVISRTPTQQNTSGGTNTIGGDYFIDSKTGKVSNTPLVDGKTVNPNLAGMSYSRQHSVGGSTSVTELRTEDLYNTWKEIIKQPEYNYSLRQEFSNQIWAYNDAYKTFNDPNSSEEERKIAYNDMQVATKALQLESGFLLKPHSFEEQEEAFNKYADLRFKELFKRAAYKHVSTQSNTSDVVNWGGAGTSSSGSGGTGYEVTDKLLGIFPQAIGNSYTTLPVTGESNSPSTPTAPSADTRTVKSTSTK